MSSVTPSAPSPTAAAAASPPSSIVMMNAVTLAAAIRSRQVSCVEVMTAYLDHIERINPHVNAIVALARSRGVAGAGDGAR